MFSWFNSTDQVDTVLVWVGIGGAIIELGVAMAAVFNVHKEIDEARKKVLERYIEIFACLAAFLFLTEAILACRSSQLLGVKIEGMQHDNLILQTNVLALEAKQIRSITLQQKKDFIESLKGNNPKCPVKVFIASDRREAKDYADEIREILDGAGYICGDSNGIVKIGEPHYPHSISANAAAPFWVIFFGNPNEPIKWPGFNLSTDTTGQMHVTFIPNEISATPGIIIDAFIKIKITPVATISDKATFLKPGEWGIFIPEKF